MRKSYKMPGFIIILSCVLFALPACSEKPVANVGNSNANAAKAGAVPNYGYEIVNTFNHDTSAFTQGLEVHDGVFYESTGGRRSEKSPFLSSLRKVEIATGKVLQKLDITRGDIFAEGLTVFNGKIYQLSWQENVCFVYDLATFKLEKELKYAGEGWGLAHDDTHLFLSDGTHVIRVVDPNSFETLRTISVFDGQGKPIMKLNELEYVKGEIWANVWEKNYIVRIDPANGHLLGTINFDKMARDVERSEDRADVLNGIAYDSANDKIYVTGKMWSKVYEVKVTPPATAQ